MQDPPPRRSRRPPPSDSGSSFPLIPIVLGMIVIGFVIGAGLSIAGKRGAEAVAVATPSPAPTPEATLAPATFAPTEKPTREPTDVPATPTPTRAPATSVPTTHGTAKASALAVATAASSVPAASGTASAASGTSTVATRAAAPAARGARVSAKPAATEPSGASVARTSSPPIVVRTAGPPTDAPPSTDDTDNDFSRLAASLVRGYVAAIARGDSASAASSLASSSDRVTEGSVIDATARITHVEARGAGDAATVNVDFETASGVYFGQYTVRRTPTGAAAIYAHTIVKP